jgi:hypothetical protein
MDIAQDKQKNTIRLSKNEKLRQIRDDESLSIYKEQSQI